MHFNPYSTKDIISEIHRTVSNVQVLRPDSMFLPNHDSFLNLCQHRFASHCCETLFIQSALIVSKELTAPLEDQHEPGEEEVYVSMENLFLYALNELQDNLGFLMSDPFASHTLRVLLLVFSGRPLGDSNATSVVQSRKKENITVAAPSSPSVESKTNSRNVPGSFGEAVDKMISGMIAGLDAHSLRALTTHPVANPILQLSLDIELSRSKKGKAKSASPLLQKLVPDESQEKFAENESFIKNLAYDTIGSRLLEVIINHAPENLFIKIYTTIFKGKIGVFAKNDVAAFAVIRLLERLSQAELKNAAEDLCAQIEPLVERSRTSMIKALIESCYARDVGTESICNALLRAYGDDPKHRLIKMLKIDSGTMEGLSEDRKARLEKQDTTGVHGSLLAQSMLSKPGPLRQLIVDGLMAMDTDMLIFIAKDRAASRTLQSSLALPDQDLKFRRVMLQRFYGHMTGLAVDTIASHVMDRFWTASTGLAFIREQIAIELLQHEEVLRGSFSGRVVWRNWNMDTYKTKRKAWIFDAREQDGSSKSGIELARARYANARKDDMAKGTALKPR